MPHSAVSSLCRRFRSLLCSTTLRKILYFSSREKYSRAYIHKDSIYECQLRQLLPGKEFSLQEVPESSRNSHISPPWEKYSRAYIQNSIYECLIDNPSLWREGGTSQFRSANLCGVQKCRTLLEVLGSSGSSRNVYINIYINVNKYIYIHIYTYMYTHTYTYTYVHNIHIYTNMQYIKCQLRQPLPRGGGEGGR